jgi:hypothetical protein
MNYSSEEEFTRSAYVRGKKARSSVGLGGVSDKEAGNVRTANIICQRQYFVGRCLNSCGGTIFLVYTVHAVVFLPSTR